MPPEGASGRPDSALDELIAKGNRLEDSGAPQAALQLYQEAARLAPESARALLNAGNALLALKRRADAEAQYRRAIELEPGSAAAHLNLGNVLTLARQFDEAAQHYEQAARLKPDWAEAWAGVGCALEGSGQPQKAVEAYQQAVRCDPGHAGAAFNACDLLEQLGQAELAGQILHEALRRNPDHPSLLRSLGELHRRLGEPEEAVRVFRRVLEANPDDLVAFGGLLMTLTYLPGISAEAALEEHRRFGALLATRIMPLKVRTAPVPGKRLKVGYVSADFRSHSMAYFIASLLACHDRSAFELYCYSNYRESDAVTKQMMRHAECWRPIDEADDAVVTRQIVADGIDILVDLSGHTAGNRLGVFARKPAPLQFTALGYPFTTGLKTIDYRLCDFHTDPEGAAERWQVETPLRVPGSQFCFQPVNDVPGPTPLPRLSKGFWTFGSFNRLPKLNEPLLRAWAAIMAAVPGSRLRFATIEHQSVRQRIRGLFEHCGVRGDRIEFVGRLPVEAYFASYGKVDIALDPFPHSGGTTSCDSLIMGVPIASVEAPVSFARNAVSLLGVLGLKGWIAPSLADLPELVRRQTADPERIARLRKELPVRLRASYLMDGPRFTRDVEAVYRAAWRRWCEQRN